MNPNMKYTKLIVQMVINMIELGFTLFGTALTGFIVGVYISYLWFLKFLDVDLVKGDYIDQRLDFISRIREDEDEIKPKYLKEEYTCD